MMVRLFDMVFGIPRTEENIPMLLAHYICAVMQATRVRCTRVLSLQCGIYGTLVSKRFRKLPYCQQCVLPQYWPIAPNRRTEKMAAGSGWNTYVQNEGGIFITWLNDDGYVVPFAFYYNDRKDTVTDVIRDVLGDENATILKN